MTESTGIDINRLRRYWLVNWMETLPDTAVFALVVILLIGMVFEQARLFRPDPMMLAWEWPALEQLY
jgi:hypothetical protein